MCCLQGRKAHCRLGGLRGGVDPDAQNANEVRG